MKKLLSPILALLSLSALASNDCTQKPESLGGEDFKVEITSYLLPSSRKHILILPPTGGSNVLDRSWARKFCASGFNAHIIERWTLLDEFSTDLELHQRLYGRSQKAIGLVLDHLEGPEYVGVFGTSIGGIFTAMAMGIHDRIDAAFVITAGADMAALIANSDQEAMTDLWEKRKSQFGIPDKKTYIDLLKPKIEYDPLQLPRKFDGKDLGMIIATEDTTVPTQNQISLQEFWKPKITIKLHSNHFWAIVKSSLWNSGKVVTFFKESSEKKRPITDKI